VVADLSRAGLGDCEVLDVVVLDQDHPDDHEGA
jgi:hypothetical protein